MILICVILLAELTGLLEMGGLERQGLDGPDPVVFGSASRVGSVRGPLVPVPELRAFQAPAGPLEPSSEPGCGWVPGGGFTGRGGGGGGGEEAAAVLVPGAALQGGRAAVRQVGSVARSEGPNFSLEGPCRRAMVPVLESVVAGELRPGAVLWVQHGEPEPRHEALEAQAAVRRAHAPQALQHPAREVLRLGPLPPTLDLRDMHVPAPPVI